MTFFLIAKDCKPIFNLAVHTFTRLLAWTIDLGDIDFANISHQVKIDIAAVAVVLIEVKVLGEWILLRAQGT